jgi:hypothetical protein
VAGVVAEEGDLCGQHTEDGRGDQLPPGRTDHPEGHPRRAEGARVRVNWAMEWDVRRSSNPAERIRRDSAA